jgi:hypothetical protein
MHVDKFRRMIKNKLALLEKMKTRYGLCKN